jgi:hypothetical protein
MRGDRGRMLAATAVCLVAAGVMSLSACGSSDDQTDTISKAELNDAVQAARQKERLKALQEQVDDLKKEDDTSSSSGGTTSSTSSAVDSGEVSYTSYTDSAAGWTAEIPTGGGWSQPTQSEPTPGRLFETQLTGPNSLFLVVDYTPSDTPGFSGAPVDSRSTASSPNFGTVQKIVFQGNSNFPLCESGLCVDYLIPSGSGGYAILAGGGSGLSEAQEVADHVLATLQG